MPFSSFSENAPSNGRVRAFTPGWLERESVFLHMEYKYFLGMLKAGLYDRFYEAVQDALIPYQKPEVYGRSILENSSFLASSANPDPSVHGQGFVARLSGAALHRTAAVFPCQLHAAYLHPVLAISILPALVMVGDLTAAQKHKGNAAVICIFRWQGSQA